MAEIWMYSVDWSGISVLVLLLCCGYARCHRCGSPGEGYRHLLVPSFLLFAASYGFILASKFFLI